MEQADVRAQIRMLQEIIGASLGTLYLNKPARKMAEKLYLALEECLNVEQMGGHNDEGSL
jgi:hypothetical protein